ncbi:MAG: sugar phosphate isomerase/epimerase [Candidatus Omnitrophica bacterium]|nr:sugar phosphate isomerase/epimerase [Candidatus Omnitrophota bacterium]
MIELSMHTDNWRCLSGSFQKAVEAARKFDLKYIEFGVVDGQDFIEGLGYSPAVSLDSNPIRLRRYLEANGLQASQIDAGYPITGPSGATFGVRYAQRAIQFAAAIGCPRIDTTDGQFKPEGYTDKEVMAITRQNYRQILEWAEDYQVIVNLETHGPYTTNPDTLEAMLQFFDSPWLRLNLDTGNTFIAGGSPVEFLKRFLSKLNYMHVKDVSPDLAAALRGESTGIAMSASAIGQGVNADNIKACIQLLKEARWNGLLSVECLGSDEILSASLAWLRQQLAAPTTPANKPPFMV